MPGPARAGAMIYAKDLERVAAFYREVLGMRTLLADAHHHVLESPDCQLIVHAIPPHIASTFEIATPPQLREEQAIKLFFTVPSFAAASPAITRLGGGLDPQEWAGAGFRARNAFDPEGNILQLREPST